MRRIVGPDNVLNLGISPDERTSVLIIDGERLPADTDVTIKAGLLSDWMTGVFALGGDALIQARDAMAAEARLRSH